MVQLLSSFDDRKIVIFSGGRVAMPRTMFAEPRPNALAPGRGENGEGRWSEFSGRRSGQIFIAPSWQLRKSCPVST
jgi:hypothetical protein